MIVFLGWNLGKQQQPGAATSRKSEPTEEWAAELVFPLNQVFPYREECSASSALSCCSTEHLVAPCASARDSRKLDRHRGSYHRRRRSCSTNKIFFEVRGVLIVCCTFSLCFCFGVFSVLVFPLLPACLSPFTDWCLVHRQQSREQKNDRLLHLPDDLKN